MNFPSITRRRFLKTASLAALATQFDWRTVRAADGSSYKNLIAPDKKLRIASIGAGGKAHDDIMKCIGENIVALCDVDFDRGGETFRQIPQAARYRDYRQMLTEMHDEIDAVIVATPDHTHYPAALMALQAGKHVYVEKPLTHTIGEARALREAARKAQVVTQMGNHGHANEGTRLVKEWIDAGVIGKVHEVHCWTNRPVWPQGLNLLKPTGNPPDTLDWNLWLGVAPERPYAKGYQPFDWRGWWDYGCGALGDMGCHVMDAPFWALDLRGDFRISAESSGDNAVSAPDWSVVRYEFPERNGRQALSLTWFDGGVKPPVPKEFGKDKPLPPGGSLYYGDKGILMTEGDYSETLRLLPDEAMKNFKNRPPKTIPRIKGANAHLEWIGACKGGAKPGSNIVDYSAALTEMVLAGNLAIRMKKPLDWNSEQGICLGTPEADRLIHKTYRVF
jgi:predicted dehydrogenase